MTINNDRPAELHADKQAGGMSKQLLISAVLISLFIGVRAGAYSFNSKIAERCIDAALKCTVAHPIGVVYWVVYVYFLWIDINV